MGHRKATKPAAANEPSPAVISVIIETLRKCRRVVAMVSGSGGTNTTGADGSTFTRVVVPPRACLAGALDLDAGDARRQVDVRVAIALARLAAQRAGTADVAAAAPR